MKIFITLIVFQLTIFQMVFGEADDVVTFYQYKEYKGKNKEYREGTYYTKNIQVKPYSLKIPEHFEVKFEYNDRYGKTRSFIFKKSYEHLRYEMDKWQLRDKSKPYNYITKIIIYNRNQHKNPNYSGAESYYKKGYAVLYKEKGYKDEYKYFKVGEFKSSSISWMPYSTKVPKGKILELTYVDRDNKTKKYQFKESTQDMYAHMAKWQVNDKKNPWKYVRKIEVKNYNGQANHHENNYKNEEAEMKLKQGYVVFFKEAQYHGEYYGKMQGTYYPNKLKFIPYGFLIPRDKYIVLEYLNHQNRVKSEVLKGNIPDLIDKLKSLKVYHKQDPKKSIRKISIMKY